MPRRQAEHQLAQHHVHRNAILGQRKVDDLVVVELLVGVERLAEAAQRPAMLDHPGEAGGDRREQFRPIDLVVVPTGGIPAHDFGDVGPDQAIAHAQRRLLDLDQAQVAHMRPDVDRIDVAPRRQCIASALGLPVAQQRRQALVLEVQGRIGVDPHVRDIRSPHRSPASVRRGT